MDMTSIIFADLDIAHYVYIPMLYLLNTYRCKVVGSTYALQKNGRPSQEQQKT